MPRNQYCPPAPQLPSTSDWPYSLGRVIPGPRSTLIPRAAPPTHLDDMPFPGCFLLLHITLSPSDGVSWDRLPDKYLQANPGIEACLWGSPNPDHALHHIRVSPFSVRDQRPSISSSVSIPAPHLCPCSTVL